MTLADGGSITCTFVNEQPSIDIEKTAGDAADGDPYTSLAGDITYTYVVTNDGANRLVDIEIVDDNGTPADLSDDFGTVGGTITCDVDPRELDPGASMTCSATVPVADSRTNVAVGQRLLRARHAGRRRGRRRGHHPQAGDRPRQGHRPGWRGHRR